MAENTIEIELYIDHVGHALYIPLSTARQDGSKTEPASLCCFGRFCSAISC